MKNIDGLKLVGRVKLECYNRDGSLKWTTGWLYNTITNAGRAEMARLAGYGLGGTRFRYLAVGTSDAAEDATDTALTAEITDSGLARAEATVSRVTTTVENDTVQFVKEWTATGSKTVEEVGVFDADADGVMLGRKLTTSKAVDNGDKLEGIYQIKFA